MTDKDRESQFLEADGVNEHRRGLLKKAATLFGVLGLAGLSEFAATNEAAACVVDQCGSKSCNGGRAKTRANAHAKRRKTP